MPPLIKVHWCRIFQHNTLYGLGTRHSLRCVCPSRTCGKKIPAMPATWR